MHQTDPSTTPTSDSGFAPPKRRAGVRPGLREAPPAPLLLRVLFWLDLAFWALMAILIIVYAAGTAVIAIVPIAAASVALAFGFSGMSRPALWARAFMAVLLGAIAVPWLVRGVLQLVRFGVFEWLEWLTLPLLAWQVVGLIAIIQALHLMWRTEQDRRRAVARARPLPAGKRHFLRPGRRTRDDARPPALFCVVVLDVVGSLIAAVMLLIELGRTPSLRHLGGLPLALTLAFPALVLAHQCWDRHRAALGLRPWFGGGVALVSAGVAGIAAPWTLTLTAYAVLSGLAIARAQGQLARRAAEAENPRAA